MNEDNFVVNKLEEKNLQNNKSYEIIKSARTFSSYFQPITYAHGEYISL